MKFDTPAQTNPIDQLKVVGKPVDRIDGPLKTTGTAPYAYERHDVAADPAYGYIVASAIAKGRIRSMDVDAAKKAPGVLAVVTAENAGELAKGDFNTAKLLGGPEIQHYHQAVAVVVAETFEQARAAASLVEVNYESAKGSFDLAAVKEDAPVAKKIGGGGAPSSKVGEFDTAFPEAPVQLDATYRTANESHCMMEPHATLAEWQGDQLTFWTSNQMVAWGAGDMAKTLGIPKEKVRLISPYVGGGFGGKLFLRADALMAALGGEGRRPTGQSDFAAGHHAEQYHSPRRDDPANPHRGDEGGENHGHRAPMLVGRSSRRRARNRRPPDPRPVCGRTSRDRKPTRGAGPPGSQRDARPRRGTGPGRPRNRDG
jgi:xanthine dehydrogenase YagR molybdenum-binding subunit